MSNKTQLQENNEALAAVYAALSSMPTIDEMQADSYDITLLTTGWVADTTYPDYGYRYAYALSGVTDKSIASLTLDANSVKPAVEAGMLSACETVAGYVYFYSAEVPASNLTGTLMCSIELPFESVVEGFNPEEYPKRDEFEELVTSVEERVEETLSEAGGFKVGDILTTVRDPGNEWHECDGTSVDGSLPVAELVGISFKKMAGKAYSGDYNYSGVGNSEVLISISKNDNDYPVAHINKTSASSVSTVVIASTDLTNYNGHLHYHRGVFIARYRYNSSPYTYMYYSRDNGASWTSLYNGYMSYDPVTFDGDYMYYITSHSSAGYVNGKFYLHKVDLNTMTEVSKTLVSVASDITYSGSLGGGGNLFVSGNEMYAICYAGYYDEWNEEDTYKEVYLHSTDGFATHTVLAAKPTYTPTMRSSNGVYVALYGYCPVGKAISYSYYGKYYYADSISGSWTTVNYNTVFPEATSDRNVAFAPYGDKLLAIYFDGSVGKCRLIPDPSNPSVYDEWPISCIDNGSLYNGSLFVDQGSGTVIIRTTTGSTTITSYHFSGGKCYPLLTNDAAKYYIKVK